MNNTTQLIELIKQISYGVATEQGYVRKFDGIVVSVDKENNTAEVNLIGYDTPIKFNNKSNEILEIGDSVKIESLNESLTDAFISEKFGSSDNLAESEIKELIVEYAVNDSPVVAPPQDDPSWSSTTIDRPLNRYIWQRTKTVYVDRVTYSIPVNITGANGSAPPLCSIYGENVFKYDINGELISSDTIVLTAELLSTIVSVWQYQDINGEWQVYPTSALNPTVTDKVLNVSADEAIFFNDVAIIRCTTNIESAQDIVSITKIYDGSGGYTVLLSNENVTFAGTILADPSSAVSLVQAFLGIEGLPTIVGEVDNIPVGMILSIQNNNTKNTSITISVTEDFISKNGELQIPITVNGELFTKTFSYSLVLNGQEGIGVESLVEQFAISDDKEIAPTEDSSLWQDTQPNWIVGKYLWHRTKVIYSDSSFSYTQPYVDTAWEATQSKNTTFTSQPTNYQMNDLWILSEDWNGFKAGEILVANTTSETFDATHWEKKISYTDDEYAESLDIIIKDNYSDLILKNDEIRLFVESNYTSNEEFVAYQSYSAQVTSDQIEFVRTTLDNDILDLDDKVDGNQAKIEEYIRFNGASMSMGKTGNSFTSELDNERLAFLQNGQAVSYISNQKMYITEAEITNNMIIGNFQWKPRANGNLSLVYIGGV